MGLSAAQCRAARALIAWSQDQLAAASSVAKATIANFEAGKREPYARTLSDIRAALEAAGVIFVDENGEGAGVRLRKARVAMDAEAELREEIIGDLPTVTSSGQHVLDALAVATVYQDRYPSILPDRILSIVREEGRRSGFEVVG